MPEQLPEVHVGDIGTTYRVRVQDEDGDFDPSGASVKELIFLMPGGVVLEKEATVEVGSGDEAGQWFLTYEVEAADGSPGDEFHETAGRFQLQAYLEWSDGTKYHSDVRTTGDDGGELRVHPNLR